MLKFPKQSFTKATSLLHLVHSDACGPLQTCSFYKLVHFEGLTIFLLLLMIILTLQRSTLWNLSLKSLQLFKFIKHLMIFKLVEKMKSFVLINGGEYNFLEFNKLYNEHGIQCQFFTFFTPSKHMGVFNKKNLHFDGIYSQHVAIYQAIQFLLGRGFYNFKKLLTSG